jgi:hypothetical protein
MITLSPGGRVYLACGVTDMHKGMVRLPMLVQQHPAVSESCRPNGMGTFGGAGRRRWLDTDSGTRIG